MVREVEPGVAGATREGAITLLADALGSGLAAEEIRELQRQAQTPLSAADFASAAKGLAFIKDASLLVSDGSAVMTEAIRQRFRSF
jgi:hypothetical protein